jgi:protein SCO1
MSDRQEAALANSSANRQVLSTLLLSCFLLLLGLATLYLATEGGTSFTTETYRRIQVDKQPQNIRALDIVNHLNQTTDLRSFFTSSKKLWIVDFIYTRCQSVCIALGSNYQRLQMQIQERGLEDRVGLLSVSFDPSNDNSAALLRYAERQKADPKIWKIVSLKNVVDRSKLLDEFGIMVIAAPFGEFEHNAAFHIVDARARLIKIVDYQQTDQLLDLSLSVLKP